MGKGKSSGSSKRPYATLELRVQNVSAATIRKKWKKLPMGSQDNVKQLFLSLKSQALVSHGKKLALADYEDCVDEVADKLSRRLPRMTFPPGTEEAHFDFEATLQRVRLLENQLTSNMHSMNLLRIQITKEEQMLKQDREALGILQDGAKSSEALRRRQNKTLHPLARLLDTEVESEQSKGLSDKKSSRVSILELEQDQDIQPLLTQLRSHLESMENNMTITKNIAEALGDAQAALDGFASQALDREQYNMLYGLEIT